MSILAFPEPKLAMTAGAQTEASRRPNWARIAGGRNHQVSAARIVRLGSEQLQVRGREPSPLQIRAYLGIACHDCGPADLLQYPADGPGSSRSLTIERRVGASVAARWRLGDGPCRARMSVGPGNGNQQNRGQNRSRPPAPPGATTAAPRRPLRGGALSVAAWQPVVRGSRLFRGSPLFRGSRLFRGGRPGAVQAIVTAVPRLRHRGRPRGRRMPSRQWGEPAPSAGAGPRVGPRRPPVR